MVGNAGRGVASPCSTISSCVVAVCDVEVVVGAGPCAAAGATPSAATITPQHNLRTDTNASLFRSSRFMSPGLRASPDDGAPYRTLEPLVHYSHFLTQALLDGRGHPGKSGRLSARRYAPRQESTRGPCLFHARPGHPCSRSRAVFQATSTQIRDVLFELRPQHSSWSWGHKLRPVRPGAVRGALNRSRRTVGTGRPVRSYLRVQPRPPEANCPATRDMPPCTQGGGYAFPAHVSEFTDGK
jgi:hypothetical protein